MTGDARPGACLVVTGGWAFAGPCARCLEFEPVEGEGEGEDDFVFFCSFSFEPFPIPKARLMNALNPFCGDLAGVLGEDTRAPFALV